MSKARDDFYNFYTLEFLEENKKDYPFIFNYISELEQQKAELIDCIKKAIECMDGGCASEEVYRILVDGLWE